MEDSAIYRIRPDLIVSTHEDAPGSVVIKDPKSGRFFSMPSGSFEVLKRFDGTKTVLDVFERLPTQGRPPRDSFLVFVQNAWQRGILHGDEAVPTAKFDKFAAEVKRFNPFLTTIAVLNPRRILPLLARMGKVLFHPIGFGVWCVLLVAAFTGLVTATPRLVEELKAMQHISWLAVSYAVLLVTPVLHEFGHAMACAMYGGRVEKMGIMLYMFRPGFYVDVGDSWLFPKARQRAVVALGGPYVDAVVLSVALILWRLTAPGTFMARLELAVSAVVLIRILFNLIPFLRLDGYYLLSDLLGIRNLRPRSFALLLSLLPVVGRPWRRRESAGRERMVMLVYGVISLLVLATVVTFTLQVVFMALKDRAPSLAWAATVVMALVMLGIGLFTIRQDLWQYRRASGSLPSS